MWRLRCLFMVLGVVLVTMAVVCAGLGWIIGGQKDRPGEGLILGLLLGVVGVVIAAVMPSATQASEQMAGIDELGTPLPPGPRAPKQKAPAIPPDQITW